MLCTTWLALGRRKGGAEKRYYKRDLGKIALNKTVVPYHTTYGRIAAKPSVPLSCSTKNIAFPRPQETTYCYLTGDKRIA